MSNKILIGIIMMILGLFSLFIIPIYSQGDVTLYQESYCSTPKILTPNYIGMIFSFAMVVFGFYIMLTEFKYTENFQ